MHQLEHKLGNFCALVVILCIFYVLIFYIAGVIFAISEKGFSSIEASFLLSSKPVESLLAYILWWIENFESIRIVSRKFLVLRLLSSILVPFILGTSLIYLKRDLFSKFRPFRSSEELHGSARWASESDIEKANLREKHGVLLGDYKEEYLVAGGYQHILLFAPTGSGKGVGFVIPNLLFWQESIVVHDIKLENFELTSGWRKSVGQDVFCWSPADVQGKTHCYNPLDWISRQPGQMVDDVQKIASLLMPKQEFWTNEARTLLVGLILYLVCDNDKNASFGEIVRTVRSDDFSMTVAKILDEKSDIIHPIGYLNLAAFIQKSDKERSGVVSTMNSSLELWANPLIDIATASSNFDVSQFKKKKTTIYVGLTPDNLKRLQPLMKVFYQQATEFLSRKMPSADEPYGVLFMMDEFPTLGQMDQFMSGIAYFRGFHVRLFLIVQDTEQLKGIYKEDGMNSFLSNATYRITFAANNVQTANLISQLIGNKTVENISRSAPRFFSLNLSSRSMNISYSQRALLLPQEVISLPKDEQILLIESSPPIKSKKIRYYIDERFTKKLLPPIELPIHTYKAEDFAIKKSETSYVEKIKQEQAMYEEYEE